MFIPTVKDVHGNEIKIGDKVRRVETDENIASSYFDVGYIGTVYGFDYTGKVYIKEIPKSIHLLPDTLEIVNDYNFEF